MNKKIETNPQTPSHQSTGKGKRKSAHNPAYRKDWMETADKYVPPLETMSPTEREVVASLSELLNIGTSKRLERDKARKKKRAELRQSGASEEEIKKKSRIESPYIHGATTYTKYIEEGRRFVRWAVKIDPTTRTLRYAKKYVTQYIDNQIARSLAPSTIKTTRSALAKLYRCRGVDLYPVVPVRKSADFTRCRDYTMSALKKDILIFGDVVKLCYATGLRRNELKHITPECFSVDKRAGRYGLHLDGKKQPTKNGRPRTVYILDEDVEIVREIVSRYTRGELMFSKIPKKLCVHGIRAMYAVKFYAFLNPDIDSISLSERYANDVTLRRLYHRRCDGRWFDRNAFYIVSKSLGHNRTDVVGINYLWYKGSDVFHLSIMSTTDPNLDANEKKAA
jgi:integrase